MYIAFRFDRTDEDNAYLVSPFKNETIEPLSAVNFFVGANHSGKSRLLRALFSLNRLEYRTSFAKPTEITRELNQELTELRQLLKDQSTNINHISLPRVFSETNDDFLDKQDLLMEFRNLMRRFEELDNKDLLPEPYNNQIIILYNKIVNYYNSLIKDWLFSKVKKIYIPILRGLRPPHNIKDSNFYSERTKIDYKLPVDDSQKSIFTGESLYKSLTTLLLGKPEGRELVKKYEDFLSKYFFNSQPITLIPAIGGDIVEVKIGDEPQLPIFNLGDGIQNIIIITFPVFTSVEKTLFFIEEPELHLHPGLHRILIDVLIAIHKKDQHQFFFTTHSNHFIDTTLDHDNISIFQCIKQVNDSVSSHSITHLTSDKKNALIDLGVYSSSVLIANCTIWVEGITDRLYIRIYLKKYLEKLINSNDPLSNRYSKFKEGIHYAFVEYQGSNLVHWDFNNSDEDQDENNQFGLNVQSIFPRSFVIADGDKRNKPFYIKLKQILDNKLLILDCKEIENLIPVELLSVYLKEKKLNDEIISSITQESYYNDVGLGRYLDEKFSFQEVFSLKSGTIKGKSDFCRKIIIIADRIDYFMCLTEAIEDICKNIYQHIDENNR